VAEPRGLTPRQTALKRGVDVVAALLGLAVTWPVLAVGWCAATISTRGNGLFRQVRVGRDGEPFEVLKLRSMRPLPGVGSTVTTSGDARITGTGAVLRRFKLDELPQLLNVLRGEMSLVGPRPDVPGFADLLRGGDRIVLSVRPGITGPAALAYRHEEELLASVPDPERHNREVIWPDKVRINRDYVENWSLARDVGILLATVRSTVTRHRPAPAAEEFLP
jgi:lipopolysaccharide/colanic/teichoic acid biosynthesis glycosyltransferase